MVERVTLISGVDLESEQRNVLERFARDSFGVKKPDLLFEAHADIALARGMLPGVLPMDLFAIRERMEMRARKCWRDGSQACYLIPRIACNRDADGYEECLKFIQREAQEVRRWGVFRGALFVGSLTPDQTVELILN